MIKTLLEEEVNIKELSKFSNKEVRWLNMNKKSADLKKGHSYNCEVLDLKLTKIKAYAEQMKLHDVLSIFKETPSDLKLGKFIGISREAIRAGRIKLAKGKKVYAYRYHLLRYRENKLKKML